MGFRFTNALFRISVSKGLVFESLPRFSCLLLNLRCTITVLAPATDSRKAPRGLLAYESSQISNHEVVAKLSRLGSNALRADLR
jgi:hypothetical protein